MVIEIKKPKVTFTKVIMNNIHPKTSVLTTAEKDSWSLKVEDAWWLGVEYTWKDYEEITRKKKTIIISPLELKTETELESHVQKQILVQENNLQDIEFRRVAEVEIIKKDEYKAVQL